MLFMQHWGKPCRCRTRVNNAGVWVQNQLNCGEVRSSVGRTRARRRREIMTGIDVEQTERGGLLNGYGL
jgi:hypothetical protein